MSQIKLKDLLKEVTTIGGIVSENPWVKKYNDTPTINIKEFNV